MSRAHRHYVIVFNLQLRPVVVWPVTPPRTRREWSQLCRRCIHIYVRIGSGWKEKERDRGEKDSEIQWREHELNKDRTSKRFSNIKVWGGDNMLKHETGDGGEENWNAAVVLACWSNWLVLMAVKGKGLQWRAFKEPSVFSTN